MKLPLALRKKPALKVIKKETKMKSLTPKSLPNLSKLNLGPGNFHGGLKKTTDEPEVKTQ